MPGQFETATVVADTYADALLAAAQDRGQADELAGEFDYSRIAEVVDYVINRRDYDEPGGAITKALREEIFKEPHHGALNKT